MTTSIIVVLVMGGVGICFGFILAFVNKKFAVEVNPLIHIVEDILPKGQCGACGYPGCMAYAEAVVTDAAVAPNLCIPGKAIVANQVAELTGKVAEAQEPKVAVIKCNGTYSKSIRAFAYEGVQDCVAANLVQGGDKDCKYGCLGYGSCLKACLFEAITEGPDGIPVINEKKCTACGACVKICPRKVISLEPENYNIVVKCNSKDKGPVAKKKCEVACIGCSICAKNAPEGTIVIENFLAKADAIAFKAAGGTAECTEKCPTKAIQYVNR